MSVENFDHSCDRLSSIVDRALYERLTWERNVGPRLARMVELARGVFADREEFELSEEGASRDIKRYIVKIHGKRVLAVSLTIHKGVAVVAGSEIERSRFSLEASQPLTADPDAIDAEWMTDAFHQIFARVRERVGSDENPAPDNGGPGDAEGQAL